MDLSPIANAVAAVGGGLRQFRAPGWTWEARKADHPAAAIVHVWVRLVRPWAGVTTAAKLRAARGRGEGTFSIDPGEPLVLARVLQVPRRG